MGSACCVAARGGTLPNRTSSETLQRDILYSPSWSFRWDNRRRVADEVENTMIQFSRGVTQNAVLEVKRGIDVETGDDLDVGSPLENFQTAKWKRSPTQGGDADGGPLDLSLASNFSAGIKGLTKSPAFADPSPSELSLPVHLISSSSTPTKDLMSFKDHPFTADSTQPKQAGLSPGPKLLRQVSDCQIPRIKSQNKILAPEGRQSFVLPVCNNDSRVDSQGVPSDAWSADTFSELVASSQRERWSLDSEAFGSGCGKISRSSSRLSASSPVDLQTCGVCSKLLKEKSSSSNHIAGSELSVVSVLVCGHVYHAECLESMTRETERYDPACPVCVNGEKQVMKMFRKGWRVGTDMKMRNNKATKTEIVDGDFNRSCAVFDHQKIAGREGDISKMRPGSSFKSSFVRPFLRRHFSLGSKSTITRLLPENDSARNNRSWARHSKT